MPPGHSPATNWNSSKLNNLIMLSPANSKSRPMSVRLLALAALSLAVTACATKTTVTSSYGLPTATSKSTTPVASTIERQVVNAVELPDGDLELKLLRRKVTDNPTDLKARLALVNYYRERGFGEIAAEHLRLACERTPDSAEAHVELARLLHRQGDLEESLAVVKTFAEKYPAAAAQSVEVWAWLGLLQDESKDFKAGEAAHRKALALAPKRDDLHNNLGYCLLEQGRKEDAAAEFREALKLNKNSVFARDNLGLATTANPKEAVLHWQSVSDPASAHSNMAAVLIEEGKYPEARKEIDAALSYNRQHRAALENLVLLSQLDGKPAAVKPVGSKAGWSKFRAGWQRFWTGKPEDKVDSTDSGKAVASR